MTALEHVTFGSAEEQQLALDYDAAMGLLHRVGRAARDASKSASLGSDREWFQRIANDMERCRQLLRRNHGGLAPALRLSAAADRCSCCGEITSTEAEP